MEHINPAYGITPELVYIKSVTHFKAAPLYVCGVRFEKFFNVIAVDRLSTIDSEYRTNGRDPAEISEIY
ncbi:MAG TPA: hypothetical protein VET88_12935 [Gammaproteobacteria bacterium]|nr:hypothetical protein [Gammaproteobacteria bacterium]